MRIKRTFKHLACLVAIIILPLTLSAQNEQKITLNLQNANALDVVKTIKETSRYKFIYRVEDLSSTSKRNYVFNGESINAVMNQLLSGSDLGWTNENGTIVIKSKQQNTNSIHITGLISDDKKNPIPGASVFVKGTSIGVASDHDGRYSIDIPSQATLVFSFIGMKSKEIHCSESKNINITLEEESKDIEEVVVTGYFNKNKASFTGNAATYTADEIKQVNPVNLLSALSVLDPSFKMTENDVVGSNPNSIPEFQIRGTASMPSTNDVKSTYVGNPNMPTFILDGFEVTSEKVFDMDPMRIESMTILKDAAATAIYGSRASNGVVVITTKQPEAGKLRLIYNVDVSYNIPDLSDYDLLNASEKLELEKAAGYFDPYGTIDQTEALERDYNYRLGLVQQGYNTYWLNKPLHKMIVGSKHSLSVEGGENAMRYSIDLTYENAPGVMKESGRKRIGMGVTLQYRLKNLTFKNSVTYDNVKSENSPYGSFSTYARLNPYYRYKEDDGNYIKVLEASSGILNRPRQVNPLYNTTLNTIDETSYSQFINNFGIDWFITDEFRLKGNIALRHKKNEGTVFEPADHTDFIDYADSEFYRKGYYEATSGRETFYDGNIVGTYFHRQNAHAINANVAWNIQGTVGDQYTVRAEGFQDDKLDYISFATQNAATVLPSGDDYVSRLMGFVGNASYSYNDTYLADASVRFDGSSKFGSDGRWAKFWSVGLGWNVHKETFMKNVDWLNILKLRGSYGMTGSQSFEPYQSLIMYEYYNQRRYQNSIGAVMIGLGNPDLKWQKTNQLNIGIDLSFLKERITLTANYYRNLSKSLLTDVTLPPSLGYSTYKENLGEIENKGYELEAKFSLIKKQNGWLTLSASAVHNTNTLKKISNSLEAWNKSQDNSTTNLNVPKVRYIEGQSINSIWGVQSLGINPANGKEIFIDASGNRTDTWSSADQVVIGCSDPDLEGNIGINGGWKGIQLSAYMQYRLRGESYNYTLVQRVENADKRYNTDRRVLKDRWQKPGDITMFKDVKDETSTRPTSRFIEKYNYLKLSSLSLSYDLPNDIISKCKMESVRLTFSMNDVFRASSVKTERGLDYPFARAFRTSLRITF